MLNEYTDVLKPPVGVFGLLDLNSVLLKLERICAEFPSNEVWKFPQAKKYDQTTIQQWIDQE